jgi:hypothetical protein
VLLRVATGHFEAYWLWLISRRRHLRQLFVGVDGEVGGVAVVIGFVRFARLVRLAAGGGCLLGLAASSARLFVCAAAWEAALPAPA